MPNFDLKISVPDLRFVAINLPEAVKAMALRIKDESVRRLDRGLGALGQLPRPKDGGKPLQRTGTLKGSIDAVPSARNPAHYIVRATGSRGSADEVAAKKKSASARQKSARAKHLESWLASNPRAFTLSKKEARKSAGLGKIKIRAVTTNAALLSVLANPPKDKRAKAGHRSTYRVLEATPLYEQLGQQVAERTLRYELQSIGDLKVNK